MTAEALNDTIESDKAIRIHRIDTCHSCDRFYAPTATCKECGCFMNAKTWLKHAKCPLNKW